ncbi:Nonribosomal peptide synthetase sirP [Metarhizium brunneum]|uniref:Nonribosomal peptide synthetase sirP n=1 Tax=Metarhizium brunneum TaxID=500148 RepID=A0A7D5YZR8_9HYPO|nr:Nonribosomal peptide synthetase sirP [Metarhizium brunneum]
MVSSTRVIFGTVLSGRDIDLINSDRIVGPMINEFQWSASKYLTENISSTLQSDMFSSLVAMQVNLQNRFGNSRHRTYDWDWTLKAKSEFPLILDVEEQGDECLRIRIVYDHQPLGKNYVKTLVNHYQNIVDQVLQSDKSTVGSVLGRIMDPDEYCRLTRPHNQFYTYFEGADNLVTAICNAVRQWPDLVAVQSGREALTYMELDDAYQQIPTRPVILLEDLNPVAVNVMSDTLSVKTTRGGTACIIFTSGSPGVPKAIALQHFGILSYISFPAARLEAGPGRHTAQNLSVGFDTCVAEIFGALCYGATLVPRHDDLFSHLQTVDATLTTPSILGALDPKDFAKLEMIVVGGESIPSALLERWGPGRKVFNSYGPSECTIGSTFCPLFIDQPITLGRPIPRMNVYILDEDLRPEPVGVPGEIASQVYNRKQLLLGSLALTIYALTEASDIVLGISFHNRNESGAEDVFGLLLDRVPIRFIINEPNLSSTEEFFAHIRQSAESAMADFASYQAIQKSLRKQGDTRHDPLFDAMVAYHSIDDSTGTREFLGGPLDLVLVRPRGGSKFPLMVELTEMQNGTISLCIEYRTTIFTDDYISRLQLTIVEVLSKICKIGQLETLYRIKSQSRAFTEKLQL